MSAHCIRKSTIPFFLMNEDSQKTITGTSSLLGQDISRNNPVHPAPA